MALPILRPFRIVQNVPLAHDIFELTLEPADDQPLFSFQAGQWVMLHLPNPDGTTWRAAFSIANAPSDSSTQIVLAIKIYGDFTKRAQAMPVGESVMIQGPYGVFTLRPSTGRVVFFAAGIGITPLRSMIRELIAEKDAREIVLFYTSRTRDGFAYEQEFRDLAKNGSGFTAVFTLTGEVPPDWSGETGRIDAEMIERTLKTFDDEYYICGPKPFIEVVQTTLASRGVDVKTKFRKEMF